MRSNRTIKYFRNFVRLSIGLTDRERFVLKKRLRYKTLELIGRKLGLTEGRVRQIEKGAIRKISSKFKQPNLFR